MQDVLKLFLARIATMMLLIVSAWAIGIFPIAVRQGTLVTLLTVGIPTVLLAIWARPGYRYQHTLIQRLFHFVIPPALLSSLLGLAVFYIPFTLQLTEAARSLGAEQFMERYAETVRTNQTGLSAFLIGAGLLLLLFVEPPSEWWVGGDSLSGDKRPAILAGVLATALVVILVVPALRDFFDLAPLTALHWTLIGAALAIWLGLIRLIWRRHLLERYFGLT
jgi:cation-transporting ATPase E